MHRVVPKLASAAGAAVAVSNALPKTVSNEAFHGPDKLEDSQVFVKSARASSSHSSLLFSSTSSLEWDYVLEEDNRKEDGLEEDYHILGPPPELSEVAEATAIVCESLRGSYAYSWPEADASIAQSEEAIKKAREAMGGSESNFVRVQGIITPSSNGLIRSGPFREALDLLSQRPEEAKNVVESLASDQNVWNAFQQNPALQSFMKKNTRVVIEDVSKDEQDPNLTEQNDQDNRESKKDLEKENKPGLGAYVKKMFEKVKSVLGIFLDSLKGPSPENSSKTDEEVDQPMAEVPGGVAGVFVLVILVIMVVVIRRA